MGSASWRWAAYTAAAITAGGLCVLHIRRKRKTAAVIEYIKAGARKQNGLLFPEGDYEVSIQLTIQEVASLRCDGGGIGTLRARVERVLLPTRKGGDLGRPCQRVVLGWNSSGTGLSSARVVDEQPYRGNEDGLGAWVSARDSNGPGRCERCREGEDASGPGRPHSTIRIRLGCVSPRHLIRALESAP
jgi:hypothetical protein